MENTFHVSCDYDYFNVLKIHIYTITDSKIQASGNIIINILLTSNIVKVTCCTFAKMGVKTDSLYHLRLPFGKLQFI